MIKDVLQSISQSGNTEKASVLSGQNGAKNTADTQPGLFGKMLQAFGQVDEDASKGKGLGVAVQMKQETTGEEPTSDEENPLLKLRVVKSDQLGKNVPVEEHSDSSDQAQESESQEVETVESAEDDEKVVLIENEEAEQEVTDAEGTQSTNTDGADSTDGEANQSELSDHEGETPEQQVIGEKIAKGNKTQSAEEVVKHTNQEEAASEQDKKTKASAEVKRTKGEETVKVVESESGKTSDKKASKNQVATDSKEGNKEATAAKVTDAAIKNRDAENKVESPQQPVAEKNTEAKDESDTMTKAKVKVQAQPAESAKRTQAGVNADQVETVENSGKTIFKGQIDQEQNTGYTKPDTAKNIENTNVESEKGGAGSSIQAEPLASVNRADRQESIPLSQNRVRLNERPIATAVQQGNQEGKVAEKIQGGHQNMAENDDAATAQQMRFKKGDGSAEIHAQLSQMKSEETREKRYGFNSLANAANSGNAEERLAEVFNSGGQSGAGDSSSNPGSFKGWMGQNSTSKGEGLSPEQEAFLKDKIMDSPEMKETGRAEAQSQSQARLGELPIANAMLRRSVLPGLTATMQKATSSSQSMSETWQKHSFELDNGQKINLSTRNVDGVIQVKLASSNMELVRLMQQYGSEIKEHLEQECDIQIDLQFDGEQEEGMSGFFGDSPADGRRGTGSPQSSGDSTISNKQAEQTLQQSVRKFGYNRMEWTV